MERWGREKKGRGEGREGERDRGRWGKGEREGGIHVDLNVHM